MHAYRTMNFKKYPGWAGNLLFWLTNLITLGMVYPATLRNIEAGNKLLGASDFLAESMRLPGGALFVAVTWLQQWFVYPWMGGAAITAVLTTFCSLLVWNILKMRQIRISALVGIALSGIILTIGFPNIRSLLEVCITLALFAGYCHLKKRHKGWWISILALFLYPIIGTESTLSLFLGMLLLDLNDSIQIRSWIISAIGVLLVIASPYLWNEYIFYLNDNQQRLCDFSHIQLWSIVILPVLIWLGKKNKSVTYRFYNLKVEWGCHLLIVLIFPAHYLLNRESIRIQEDFYAMEQSAETGDWNKVLELANSHRPNYTDLHLRYALLAENELGTLPDHLFNYPVSSTTDLFFWRKNEVRESFFNGLFYKSAGVADEYMHQIFEMATSAKGGMSARAIRHLTEASIMQNDKALANKFYKIAVLSQKEEPWTGNIKQQINRLNGQNINTDSIPERSTFFIGSYKPQTEITYMALNDSNNIKRINLMLCSFLLEKDLNHFQRALVMYQGMFKDKLPQAYAEAYLLLTMANRGFRMPLNISNKKMQEWMSYLQMLNQNQINEINQLYANTYWYYYLYTEVKTLQ